MNIHTMWAPSYVFWFLSPSNYSRWTKYSNPAARTMLNPRTPKSQCFSARVSKSDVRGLIFSSIGANALQVTITLNFGGEGVVPDRRGLNISSIYGSSLQVPETIARWWFQTCFIVHFIYGMSSFPLTNSYLSKWVQTTNHIYIYIYIYTYTHIYIYIYMVEDCHRNSWFTYS